jgi:hypothetical protein
MCLGRALAAPKLQAATRLVNQASILKTNRERAPMRLVKFAIRLAAGPLADADRQGALCIRRRVLSDMPPNFFASSR